MQQAKHFKVHPGWQLLLRDMGLNPSDILKLGGLPADLFIREGAQLNSAQFYDLWHGIEQAAGKQNLPLLLGQAISVEAFDTPVFACLCSENLNVAMVRLSQYKRLIGPMHLQVDVTDQHTTLTLDNYGYKEAMPHSLAAAELVFKTQLVRLATREKIKPIKVTLPTLPDDLAAYRDYFGVEITTGETISLSFSAADAQRPFLTENPQMWQCFSEDLTKKLAALEQQASTKEKVEALLLKMLPSGETSMEHLAGKLAMSKRTLQRKLSADGTNFQDILQTTRSQLADHYLAQANMPSAEIAFLLGFQDSNSFIRAYHQWTGSTPGERRLIT